MSRQRLSNNDTKRPDKSVGTETLRPAAFEKLSSAQARRTISVVAVNHNPRPGSLSSRSGTASPFGEITKRIISSRDDVARVYIQCRSGMGFSDLVMVIGSILFWRVGRCFFMIRRHIIGFNRLFAVIIKPMRARGHNDGIRLLLIEAIVRKQPAALTFSIARLN